jgi:ADP-ribose pyrophosphatase YjhB (NUDIX family)
MNEDDFLKGYRASDFDLMSVAVDTAVFGVEVERAEDPRRRLDTPRLKVLLVKRAEHPFLGLWSLPGGFVGPEESLSEAASRVVFRKTGLRDLYLEQLYAFGDPGRDPRTRVVSLSYLALLNRTALPDRAPAPVNGGAAGESAWFGVELDGKDGFLRLSAPPDALTAGISRSAAPPRDAPSGAWRIAGGSPLAFDHADILLAALARLRGKIEYTDLAFSLMPETFTVSHLMAVYEAILGERLIPAAFRRKMAGAIEPTGELTEARKFRPARLFRRRTGGPK